MNFYTVVHLWLFLIEFLQYPSGILAFIRYKNLDLSRQMDGLSGLSSHFLLNWIPGTDLPAEFKIIFSAKDLGCRDP